jgi:hypothetical protein
LAEYKLGISFWQSSDRIPKGQTQENHNRIPSDRMSYTLRIMPMEIDEIELKEIKKLGFHDWIFQQAELKNIEYDLIERDADNTEVYLDD